MKRPFAFIGFSVAVTLIILNITGYKYAFIVLLSAAVLFAASLLIKRIRQAKALPVVAGSVVFACFIFILVNINSVIPARALNGVTSEVSFRIIDLSEYNSGTSRYSYIVKTQSIDADGAPQSIKLKLYTSEKLNADYYDTVNADVTFFGSCENAFESYGSYGDGRYISANLNSFNGVQSAESRPVGYYLLSFREKIISIFQNDFDGNAAGMAIGLLTGNSDYMSDEFTGDIRACGLNHYFAVSGFHISVVCLGLYFALKLLNTPKVINAVLTMTVMFIYCSAADFSKSAVRACIMAAVMLLSRLLNSKSDTLNSLGLSVFILCFNPFAVTDAGAVLTVSAVIGICVVNKAVSKHICIKNSAADFTVKSIVFSTSVLVSVIPALYLFFKSASIMSVFLNLLIEPVVSVLMILLIIYLPVSFVPYMSDTLRFLINALTSFMKRIVSFCADNFDFLYLDISGEIIGLAIGAVLIFAAFCIFIKKEVPVKATALFSCVVIAVSAAAVIYDYNTGAYVYVSRQGTVIVSDSDAAVIIGAESELDFAYADRAARRDNVVLINSMAYKASRKLKEQNLLVYDDFSLSAGENISLSCKDEVIILSVKNRVFEINESCVIINGKKFTRTAAEDFRNSFSYMIYFKENSQMTVRRE